MTANQLTAWRTRHKLTRTAAADRLGLSRRQIYNYEEGHSPIPRSVALACAALELGVDDYAGGPLRMIEGDDDAH